MVSLQLKCLVPEMSSHEWINCKSEFPPDSLIVEVKGIDAMGNYTMQAKYIRYKSPRQKQGRWMHFIKLGDSFGYWDKYNKQEKIQYWRSIANDNI